LSFTFQLDPVVVAGAGAGAAVKVWLSLDEVFIVAGVELPPPEKLVELLGAQESLLFTVVVEAGATIVEVYEA
jgi:hypothetical protein